jgi:hypothetical protein
VFVASMAANLAVVVAAPPAGSEPSLLRMSVNATLMSLWSCGWLSADGVALVRVLGGTAGGYGMTAS